MNNGYQERQVVVLRPKMRRLKQVEIPLKAPCSIDQMAEAIAKAKELGISGAAVGWRLQEVPGAQMFVVQQEESSVDVPG